LINEKDLIYLTSEDIYTLFDLEDRGLDIIAILGQEGMDAKERIPTHWLDPKTENLLIDDLIEDIVERGAADDEFVQKAILVLIGTVIAPYSIQTIPKSTYALVEDLERLPRLNWNGYTLRYTMEAIRMCKCGSVMRHWPKGNILAIQVHIYIYLQFFHLYLS
jgi:GT2 family glycosyltransferase